jgi:ABC-type polysaccharide/polyol phosphate transport system ATPase subunit
MSGALVSFDGVWKKFRRGERHDSLRDLIPSAIKRLSRRPTGDLPAEEFWALQDVSFVVAPGRALGIIGPNGAGKSTTLKLLTRILRPTRGTSQVKGRVGALIEVAAGFHPDLTGRENVYLQGAVMGMTGRDVARRFDDIVDFAGVGGFIDTQIKRYSSGMNARLGFSIAAHLDPDVLIIDEVLSVGDMAFQERCIARMREFKAKGVTIVFVSHNLQAVTDLCDEVVYLNRQLRSSGPASRVIDQYVREAFVVPATREDGDIRIRSAALETPTGTPVTTPISPGELLVLRVRFETARPVCDLNFAFRVLRSTDQLVVYDGHFSQIDLALSADQAGEFTIAYQFTANLTRGQYYFDVFARHQPTQRYLTRLTPAGHVTVVESRTWGGVADLEVRPEVIGHARERSDERGPRRADAPNSAARV